MIAIIVAAGSSRRMGFDKLTANLAAKPVVAHSLLAFAQSSSVTRIILVVREDRLEEFRGIAAQVLPAHRLEFVAGGAERHLSVWNGLQAALADKGDGAAASPFVAVHDAARPLIQPREIEACLELACRKGAVAAAAPIADTLKRVNAEGEVTGSIDREGLWSMQTPQIFRAALLEEAYRAVLKTGGIVTDEVSAIQHIGHPVTLYRNDQPNFKITVPRDLDLARLVLASRMG